jgi:hypothetical protein
MAIPLLQAVEHAASRARVWGAKLGARPGKQRFAGRTLILAPHTPSVGASGSGHSNSRSPRPRGRAPLSLQHKEPSGRARKWQRETSLLRPAVPRAFSREWTPRSPPPPEERSGRGGGGRGATAAGGLGFLARLLAQLVAGVGCQNSGEWGVKTQFASREMEDLQEELKFLKPHRLRAFSSDPSNPRTLRSACRTQSVAAQRSGSE